MNFLFHFANSKSKDKKPLQQTTIYTLCLCVFVSVWIRERNKKRENTFEKRKKTSCKFCRIQNVCFQLDGNAIPRTKIFRIKSVVCKAVN